jgi:hypothetical protein
MKNMGKLLRRKISWKLKFNPAISEDFTLI